MSNRQCQGVFPRYSMKDFYICSSNKSTINHHLRTRTTLEEVSHNEGPPKSPELEILCPWMSPAHHAKVQNMCDPPKLFIKLDRLLVLSKTFNGQEARSSIPTSSKHSLETENSQSLDVTFSIQKREHLQFLPPTHSICQHTILASKVTPQKGKTFYC